MRLPFPIESGPRSPGAAPCPAAPAPEEVWAQHDGLGTLLRLLPALSLTAAQRAAFGPRRYADAPRLVHEVIAAIERTQGPPAPARALCRELSLRMARALSLRSLERLLLCAARRAGDLALREEVTAVTDATAMVRRAEARAASCGAAAPADDGVEGREDDEAERRLRAQLRPARDLLARGDEARRRGRRAQAARAAASRAP